MYTNKLDESRKRKEREPMHCGMVEREDDMGFRRNNIGCARDKESKVVRKRRQGLVR